MRAGTMKRVIIQEPNESRDATYNEPVASWSNVATTYAARRVLSQRERFQGEAHTSTVDTEWTFRYRSPFDPRWRIKEVKSGELHDIQAVHDPDGRRRELVVLTTTFRPDANTEMVP